jgi:hypothetical protein
MVVGFIAPGQGGTQTALRGAIEAERCENSAVRFRRREMPVTENIPEILLDSISLGGVAECVVERHTTNVAWSSAGSKVEFFNKCVQLRLKRGALLIESAFAVAQFRDLGFLLGKFAGVILDDLLLSAYR